MTLRPRPKHHTAARARAPQRGACTCTASACASAGAPDCGALAGAPDRGALAGAPDRSAVHLHAHTATGVNPARHTRTWDFYRPWPHESAVAPPHGRNHVRANVFPRSARARHALIHALHMHAPTHGAVTTVSTHRHTSRTGVNPTRHARGILPP